MERSSRLTREIWGVIIFVLALLITLSLTTYDPNDKSFNTPSGNIDPTHNWIGPIGSYVADLLLQGLGGFPVYLAQGFRLNISPTYLVPLFLLNISYLLFRRAYSALQLFKTLGYLFLRYVLLLWSFALIFSLKEAGGLLGDASKRSLIPLFGEVGAYLIGSFLLLLTLMFTFRISLVASWEWAQPRIGKGRKWVTASLRTMMKQLEEWREKRKAENRKKEQREYIPPPIILKENVKDEPPRKPRKKPAPVQEQFALPEFGQAYTLPSPSLLDPPDSGHVEIDKETLDAIGLTLQRKLTDLGVEGQLKSVHPGPVITMFKFEPAAGVKVRRIVTLADDLAMALRALSVRILAPIPGESVVGIEIPNPRREKVFLQQVIGSDDYQNAESKLTLALGKAISGLPYLADLARMPHLLVAGATGTGKSVSINAMILSMLYKATPKDVQFIMIDPKMLELSVYEELPHMLVPVVTDPKKAASALFWAMD